MRCAEFAARWNAVLDLRACPESDAELRLHLESCPACRAAQAGFELVCDVLSAEQPELLRAASFEPDFSAGGEKDDLAQRVLADLAAGAPANPVALPIFRFRHLAARAGAIGVAAATLLAMYLSGGSRPDVPPRAAVRHAGRSVGADVAQSATGPVTGASGALPSAALPSTAGGVDLAPLAARPHSPQRSGFGAQAVAHGIGAMAHRIDRVAQGAGAVALDTSQELATVVRRIPDVAIELAGDGRSDLATASEPLLSVSQSLRPVTASMAETWQILKRAVPLGEPRRG